MIVVLLAFAAEAKRDSKDDNSVKSKRRCVPPPLEGLLDQVTYHPIRNARVQFDRPAILPSALHPVGAATSGCDI